MISAEEQVKRLEEGKKLPVADVSCLSNIPAGIDKDKLNEYLSDFAKPTGSCWLCRKHLVVDWEIAHGESFCTTCGVNSRTYHYIETTQGERKRLVITLQYHPSNYEVQSDKN